MAGTGTLAEAVGQQLRIQREASALSPADLEKKLGLGPGWVECFEKGEHPPDLGLVGALLETIGADPTAFFAAVSTSGYSVEHVRAFVADADGPDLIIRFPYGKFKAEYRLSDATIADFNEVVEKLRRGLAPLENAETDADAAAAVQSKAVADAFHLAVRKWPDANPSDLWYFVVCRAYLDPYNHPATHAQLDLGQSWKRTAGWALELVLVQHYGAHLKSEYGVNLEILTKNEITTLLDALGLEDRLEADKVDVVITVDTDEGPIFVGVVHVKASFAERRTDDVPMSKALVEAGYYSPLWTMDAKATPSAEPKNRGELGKAEGNRSAKRKDIEDDGYFTLCCSYNRNTEPTAANIDAKAKVALCDFSNPADGFAGSVGLAAEAQREKSSDS